VNIERGPRKQRGFVIIDNTLAQNNRLSFGARGLAEYLLSLPPGSQVDIRSLAADNPEGRSAIAGYMNELEAERYLVRTRTQGERGRFKTSTTMYEEPQDPASMPESLPKPWSKAKRGEQPRLAAVRDETAELTFSQVGPNPVPPDFGGPDFGGPGPGRPDAGDAGVNPYGVKEPGERTSSPARENMPSSADANEPGGGGGDASRQQEQDARAVAFVDGLPYRGRLPGPRQRAHLVQRVGEAFAEGWTEYMLRKQLTEETSTAKSLAAVYRHRLEPDNLPAVSVPTGTVPAQRPKAVVDDSKGLRPECDECGRPIPATSITTVCIDCREDASA
jgi:hypothetical protein